MKVLKGAKLDAEKRGEYLSEMNSAETWETSSWPSWVVTGRVFARTMPSIDPDKNRKGYWRGRKSSVRLQVIQSHISAVCAFESGNPGVFEIAEPREDCHSLFPRSVSGFSTVEERTRSCLTSASDRYDGRDTDNPYLRANFRDCRPRSRLSVRSATDGKSRYH